MKTILGLLYSIFLSCVYIALVFILVMALYPRGWYGLIGIIAIVMSMGFLSIVFSFINLPLAWLIDKDKRVYYASRWVFAAFGVFAVVYPWLALIVGFSWAHVVTAFFISVFAYDEFNCEIKCLKEFLK